MATVLFLAIMGLLFGFVLSPEKDNINHKK